MEFSLPASATGQLAQDHQHLEEAFLKCAESPDAGQQWQRAERLCRALEIHGRLEEGLFYPAVARALPDPGMIGELTQEHARIKRLISELRMAREEGGLSPLGMRRLLSQLRSCVQEHVAEEEELAFPFLKADPRRDLQLGTELGKLQAKFKLIPPLVRSTVVQAPVRTVYNQWTQFETFPAILEDVKSVRQLDPPHVRWDMVIAGREVRWTTLIVEQIPDERIAWKSVEGAVHCGSVTFREAARDTTRVLVELAYEPQGLMEDVGAMLGVVERKAERALIQFKQFLEASSRETGAWRGRINN